jgi:hypothetical protein
MKGGREKPRKEPRRGAESLVGEAEVEDELRRDGDAVERQESQHTAEDDSEM